MSPSPLGWGIGRRYELRHDIGSRSPCRVVERRHIFPDRAAGPLRIAILAPVLTRNRALLVGVCLDQARIDCKAFTANKTSRNAPLDNTLEHATEYFSLAESLVAGARKCRMIRDSILDTELAEPTIGEVHLHFTTDQPLRTDRKDISHDKHPDHQLRINRRTTHGRIMRCKFAAKVRAGREQHRSSAPDDLREPRRQDETRRTVDLGHPTRRPPFCSLADIPVSKTESRFYLNRL